MTRTAQCRCGALRVDCEGEPVRVSVCHCLDCQRRSGSAFAFQARFPKDRVTVTGELKAYVHVGDSGNRATFNFCPDCGVTVTYVLEDDPDRVAVPIGGFADPSFPRPKFSVYEVRKHAWIAVLGDDVEHM